MPYRVVKSVIMMPRVVVAVVVIYFLLEAELFV
jgi:hypothetical protein